MKDRTVNLLCWGISLAVWITFATFTFVRAVNSEFRAAHDWSMVSPFISWFACYSAILSGILTFNFVSLPTRIAFNLFFVNRRRTYAWETIVCVVLFVPISWFVFYIAYFLSQCHRA